jgi:hypothetical protein
MLLPSSITAQSGVLFPQCTAAHSAPPNFSAPIVYSAPLRVLQYLRKFPMRCLSIERIHDFPFSVNLMALFGAFFLAKIS